MPSWAIFGNASQLYIKEWQEYGDRPTPSDSISLLLRHYPDGIPVV
jgi:hypothetical protein